MVMRVILTILFFILSSAALAKSCPASPANEANECLSAELANLESLLNKQFKSMRAGVPENDPDDVKMARDLLIKSQNSWISYRNAHCEYVGFMEGGVAAYKNVRKLQCMVHETLDRDNELKRLSKNYNGN